MLADGLRNHRGPLRASLQAVYGIRLAQHDLSVFELADLTAELPAGCAFWQSFGGPKAYSDDTSVLLKIEYVMRMRVWQAGEGSGTKPEPAKPPPFAYEKRSEEASLSRAQRLFEARHGSR